MRDLPNTSTLHSNLAQAFISVTFNDMSSENLKRDFIYCCSNALDFDISS